MKETIIVTGALRYSDGKPAVEESVVFDPENAGSEVEAEARAITDTEGRFSIKILKGLKGQLYGTMNAYVGVVQHCPKLVQAIRESGSDTTDLKTPPLHLTTERNQYDVELKYPFPSCKKTTE